MSPYSGGSSSSSSTNRMYAISLCTIPRMVAVLRHYYRCRRQRFHCCRAWVNVWTNVRVHTNCRKTWNFICFHMDVTFRLESICTAVFGLVDDDDDNSDGTDWNVLKLLAGVWGVHSFEFVCRHFYHISEWEPPPVQNLLRCQAGMANESRKIHSK